MSSKNQSKDENSFQDRLWNIVGRKRGDVAQFARKIDIPHQTLSQYLKGERSPHAGFLRRLIREEGINLNWLITGEGPKYRPRPAQKKQQQPRRIPILGQVPAGKPGGARWVEYDVDDLLEVLVDNADPYLIGLRVEGESMFPTLFPGDLVVMSPESAWETGDLVVAEVEGASEDYLVKRLGEETRREIVLIADNFLYFEPQRLRKERVKIRGRIIRVVRTPSRRGPHQMGKVELIEFYREPRIQEILGLLPGLGEKAQRAIAESIRIFAEADL